ncbi:MAG: hypothetical protein COZ75_11905 [Flavobacteriaceae bacterium CG_4_8_14_3_um_filter_34_10]|nr:hypothetical protein [Flavobacteriia bacterium]OIP49653.1 MAG: hypothetical protein AUK33_10015 [Flavobacteriaceae bacterium CG2_30_34_30]PIQ19154.1 MAG: hypothetical protein COW66_02570 [Flavobacteriaceae bacterium CG18_big_fil_WC_8_21_14_2_50_34_36]PIV48389.1 MAG: hypothetical protein COS19_14110 [Flavobacteriaceae bacterium CG02_land_8_20_14_3_00_34_13]PIX08468.1 MAG: hypothetical protein COZ75_11905 [Flavobacteriaceae bacterium CG_4_8_14_3_um_filter_34_10]PIZ09019.1 MAG: hypothetical pr
MNTLLKNKKPVSFRIEKNELISPIRIMQTIDVLEVINDIRHQNVKNPIEGNFCLITDREGIIQYLHPDFLSYLKLESSSIKKNCILDWIHPEDVTATIEYIIRLIQEKTTNIITEIRFNYEKNVYLPLKWNISYFRNLLFFNILDTPDLLLSERNDTFISSVMKSKLTLQHAEEIIWKNQVAKTISEYDKHMFASIAYCTQLE